MGFLDVPDQGAAGIQITDAEIKDGTLILKVKAANLEYSGKLSGESLDGDWKQAGNATPLSLKKVD